MIMMPGLRHQLSHHVPQQHGAEDGDGWHLGYATNAIICELYNKFSSFTLKKPYLINKSSL